MARYSSIVLITSACLTACGADGASPESVGNTELSLAPDSCVNRPVDGTYNVTAFGASATANDNTAAINFALSAASSCGGIVFFPPGTFKTLGGHRIPAGVTVRGSGVGATVIRHISVNATGDETLKTCFSHYGEMNASTRTGLENFRIDRDTNDNGRADGDSDADGRLIDAWGDDSSANGDGVGLRVSDSYGFQIHNIVVRGYSVGVGLLINNATTIPREGMAPVSYWTEGVKVDDYSSIGNSVGIEFRHLHSYAGTDSFAYTRLMDFALAVPSNGIGIKMHGPTTSEDPNVPTKLYNGEVKGAIWLNGPGATGMSIAPQMMVFSTDFFVRGECGGDVAVCNSVTGLRNEGLLLGTGSIVFQSFTGENGTPLPIKPVLKEGSTTCVGAMCSDYHHDWNFTVAPVPERAGVTFNNKTSDFYRLPGSPHKGTGFGFFTGKDIASPTVWMFDHPNNAFEIRTVGSVDNAVANPTNGTTRFKVSASGAVGIGGEPSDDAILTVNSMQDPNNPRGVLLPKMSQGHRNWMSDRWIADRAAGKRSEIPDGVLIYQTDADPGLRLFIGGRWKKLQMSDD